MSGGEGVAQFDAVVQQLPELLDSLRRAPAHPFADHATVPKAPGIYLFTDDTGPVYVGQTRNLRTRLRQHTAGDSKQNQASFAFNVAKRDAGAANVPMTTARDALQFEEQFVPHFTAAKAAVAAMRVQWIELSGPIERTLFEIYAALALGTTEFNSFETH